jgi:hypothetical protein
MEDTLQPLAEVVETCRAAGMPLVIGGDLYDVNNPPARLVYKVTEILNRMEAPIYLIQGNHDKDPETPWGSLAPKVQHIHGKTVVLPDGLRIHGLDFAPASIITPQIAAIPECDILILHQALKQGLGFEGAWNCDLDWVPSSKTRNVLIGDLHRVYDPLWSTDGGVLGVYPGSQYMTSVDESPEPKFLVVDGLDPNGFMRYQRVPLKHRPFRTLEITSQATVDNFLQDTDLGGRPIVHLKYSTEFRELAGVLRRKLEDFAYIVETPVASKETFSAQRKHVLEAKQVTLGGLINERYGSDPDKPFRELAGDLAGARSVEDVRALLTKHRDTMIPKKVA